MLRKERVHGRSAGLAAVNDNHATTPVGMRQPQAQLNISSHVFAVVRMGWILSSHETAMHIGTKGAQTTDTRLALDRLGHQVSQSGQGTRHTRAEEKDTPIFSTFQSAGGSIVA